MSAAVTRGRYFFLVLDVGPKGEVTFAVVLAGAMTKERLPKWDADDVIGFCVAAFTVVLVLVPQWIQT